MHRVTRHRATIRAFRMLHPAVGSWIAHQLSRKLADNPRDRAVLDRAERAQAQYAEQLLARRPDLNLAILAHTHRPALSQLPNGRAYLNPGAFLDGGRYAVITKKNVELKTFTKASYPRGTTSTCFSFSPKNLAPTLRKCGSSSETTKRCVGRLSGAAASPCRVRSSATTFAVSSALSTSVTSGPSARASKGFMRG